MVFHRMLSQLFTSAANQSELEKWVSELIIRVDREQHRPRTTVRALAKLIEETAELRMLAETMFHERPLAFADSHAPSYSGRIHDWHHLTVLLDATLSMAPRFNSDGFVGLLPIYSLLIWFLCTPSGARLFLDPRVNAAMKLILAEWGSMLTSEVSCYVLSNEPDGWLGSPAMAQMPDFASTFVCEPEMRHYGFRSWDDFFTRRLKPGVRPVAAPGDGTIIVSACEAAPYRISHGVACTDAFWLKSNPYSLTDMLADAKLANLFEGGTVYQGLLSPTNYHRWHSPVDGQVIEARVQPGLYYWVEPSASLSMSCAIESQSYLAQLSTRAVISIEANNPDIGLMCVVFVGLFDCSTCEVTVRPSDRVAKGDELGMFHFGGSTHCLVFRPGTQIVFDLHGQTIGPNASNIPVKSRIATVLRAGV